MPLDSVTFDARLIGGPFDGDEGIIEELPGILWAWKCCGASCPATPEHCRNDSRDVHWSFEEPVLKHAKRLGMVAYRRDALTREGWWRFIYADGLADPMNQATAQQLATTGGAR